MNELNEHRIIEMENGGMYTQGSENDYVLLSHTLNLAAEMKMNSMNYFHFARSHSLLISYVHYDASECVIEEQRVKPLLATQMKTHTINTPSIQPCNQNNITCNHMQCIISQRNHSIHNNTVCK